MSYDVFTHSRQPNNAYVGGSNEAAEMAKLTAQLADLARRDYGRTIVTPPRVDYNGDGAESFYDNYLWINAHARDAASAIFFHSNAAGDSMILAADNPASRALRDRMINALNRAAIMPYGDVWTAYERQVSELTKPVVPIRLVVEVGQHDRADYADWLRRGIADGSLARKLIVPIAEAFGWVRVADPLVATTPKPAPAPAPSTSGRLLKLTDPFMRGDDVRQLQREALRVFPSYAKALLGRAGADGIYGKGSAAFVTEFQRRHFGAGSREVDGKVGSNTRAAMASYGMRGF